MPTPKPQAAALAVRGDLVCLVTSRTGRRWVVPKGGIARGHTPAQAAAAEAWEEAGLLGVIDPTPVGVYSYEKLGRTHAVTVFRLEVTSETDDFPERGFRTRAWLTPAEALGRILEPDLREIVQTAFGLPVLAAGEG